MRMTVCWRLCVLYRILFSGECGCGLVMVLGVLSVFLLCRDDMMMPGFSWPMENHTELFQQYAST